MKNANKKARGLLRCFCFFPSGIHRRERPFSKDRSMNQLDGRIIKIYLRFKKKDEISRY
jgi:hypothetical protein